jgi:hypothetical protein
VAQVWTLPIGDVSPSRVLVQRLEYEGQLERLPPLDLVVTQSHLVLLPPPSGFNPVHLSEMLFRAASWPSGGRAPSLEEGVQVCRR